MTERDETDVKSQFAAEIDVAFNPMASFSLHILPLSFLLTQSVKEVDDDSLVNKVSPFSLLPSRDEQEIVLSVNQQRQEQPIGHRHAWSEQDANRARVYTAQELSEDRRTFESESQLPLLDLHSAASKKAPSIVEESAHVTLLPPCTWLPLTLRWPFMMALCVSALALGIVTIVLSLYSVQNYGLCDYSDSMGFSFAWKFLPTLIAVIYALGVTVLINDVKRTEAFAKLSNRSGSSALSSLFVSDSHWWEDPKNALSKNGIDGRRSWTLLWVSIANIMAVLLVSPLSSGLLSLSEMQIPRRTDFLRLEIPSPLTSLNTTTEETYFRTISRVVRDLKTSAWLRDYHAILPFWPADLDSVPFGRSLMPFGQQWQGQTTVFTTDLRCTSMDLTYKNYNPSEGPGYQSIILSSLDGCTLEVNVTLISGADLPSSGGFWSNVDTINLPLNLSEALTINQSSTAECGGQEVIFIASPFHANFTNGSIAQLCAPKYFVAHNVTTTVSETRYQSEIAIDDKEFNQTKMELDPSFIDLGSFETQFLDPGWAAYFQPPTNRLEIRPSLGGPLLLLVATLQDPSSDLGPIFNTTRILDQAKIVKHRFFGESLQARLVAAGDENAQKITAQVIATKTRLAVGPWIGVTLGVIFLTSAAMIAFAFYCSRLRRRPLNLIRDPGSTAAMVSIISQDARIGDYFRGFDRLPEDSMKTILGQTMFAMVNGYLILKNDGRLKARASWFFVYR